MPVYQATIDQIQALLAEKVPKRAIARRLGVSRNLVGNVAAGTWKPRARRQAKPTATPKPRREIKFHPIPPTRCPRCRALIVTSPCVACYTRLVASPMPATHLDK